MDNFELLLCDCHGIVVQHREQASPHRVREMMTMFGKVCQCDAYALRDGTYATLGCFDDATSCQMCYHTLRAVLTERTAPALVNVGWVHEDSVRLFHGKPYVKDRFDWKLHSANAQTATPQAAHPSSGAVSVENKNDEEHEYLLMYLLRSTQEEKKMMQLVAKARALDYFVDEKEGGRLFLCFRDYDSADDYRQNVVDSLPHLQRDISFVDCSSYQLAKSGSTPQQNV